jgi:hypothetical protein
MKTQLSYIENMCQVNRDLRESICVHFYWHEMPKAILCLMCSIHLADTFKNFLPPTKKKTVLFHYFRRSLDFTEQEQHTVLQSSCGLCVRG